MSAMVFIWITQVTSRITMCIRKSWFSHNGISYGLALFNILLTHCNFVGAMTNFVHAYYKCDCSVLHNNSAYVSVL